ncbi:MAG TPA: aspartate/glutamate racemase family protein [Steroidobacteraceae bacterium]
MPQVPARSDTTPREYGRRGVFGILTPQSNAIAEQELRILLPPACSMVSARLTSAGRTLERRLADYGERLDQFLDQFGNIAADAVGVACTGSFYGLDRGEERTRRQARQARRGCPVVTSVDAIDAALRALGIGSIAIVSPYPAWLTESCRSHWVGLGTRVTGVLQLSSGATEPHRIYSLTSASVLEETLRFDVQGAEAILLSGTGMPSLRVIQQLEPTRGIPVLSSSLCLAWALARTVDLGERGPESRLYGGWAGRLALALA